MAKCHIICLVLCICLVFWIASCRSMLCKLLVAVAAYQPQAQVQVTTLLGVLDTASSQQRCHFINSRGSKVPFFVLCVSYFIMSCKGAVKYHLCILCLVFHTAKSHQWTLHQHNNIVLCVIILLILHQPHWHCFACKHLECQNQLTLFLSNFSSSYSSLFSFSSLSSSSSSFSFSSTLNKGNILTMLFFLSKANPNKYSTSNKNPKKRWTHQREEE